MVVVVLVVVDGTSAAGVVLKLKRKIINVVHTFIEFDAFYEFHDFSFSNLLVVSSP